jgi:hypothetical protein
MGGTTSMNFPYAVTLWSYIRNASVEISCGIFTAFAEDFNGFPQYQLVNAVMIL